MIQSKNNVSTNVLFMAQQFQNMAMLNNSSSLPQHSSQPNIATIVPHHPQQQHPPPQQQQQQQQSPLLPPTLAPTTNVLQQQQQLTMAPNSTPTTLDRPVLRAPVSTHHHLAPLNELLSAADVPVPTPRDNSSTHLYQNQPILSRRNYEKSHNDSKEINHELINKQAELSGVLILDFERLLEDRETADVVFLLGSEPDETAVYAHRAILRARCRSFQDVKPEELCRIPKVAVSPTSTSSTNVIHWPRAKAPILQDVLYYVYSAKLRRASEEDVFEYLSISSDLDLPELVDFYTEEATKMLNVENVFGFLENIFQLEEHINFDHWLELLMKFISENALYCVETASFLNLSKRAITYLASSDCFALDEAAIFHYLVIWAQHKSGIVTPLESWSEEERILVNQQLAGVINHVRIFLIDSQTFAQKIDSTGLLPIEFSLDFYKFAALAAGQQKNNALAVDKRLQPRMLPFDKNRCLAFLDSKLLSSHDGFETLLNQWADEPSKRQWRRIFVASQHDFSVDAFHHYCDGFAPTFVLALSTSGHLSGGYADIPWSQGDELGRGRYLPSDKSFVFNLHSPDFKPPTRYDIKKRMFALAHHSRLGPVFGAGADLSIADRCNTNTDSYSNLPHSYEGRDASCGSLFGDYNFTVAEYEVFTYVENTK